VTAEGIAEISDFRVQISDWNARLNLKSRTNLKSQINLKSI